MTSPTQANDEHIETDQPSSTTALPRPIDNLSVPKPKRLACVICRKRKLKCDGARPSCNPCSRLGHPCAYDEVRKKSGPKRGYVKALEERLQQVELLLKTQDPTPAAASGNQPGNTPVEQHHNGGGGIRIDPRIQTNANTNEAAAAAVAAAAAAGAFNMGNPSIQMATDRDMDRWRVNPTAASPQTGAMNDFNFNATGVSVPVSAANNVKATGEGGEHNNFTWEMIGLGLEEPLPAQETIDDLHQLYFQKIGPTCPIIHKFRYLNAMNLAPPHRPPVCLRYAMWTLACSVTEKYQGLKDMFYQRARKYLESDYVKGHGENMISVAHAQTHILLAKYELKMMFFPRAWMSTGAGVRLCQMMGLHRLDGAGLDVKQCVPPPRDWTEKEERRRTFWMAFCEDRYASIGTGWPMTIDETDISTDLPSSDEAFEMSRPETTQSLSQATSPSGASKLSSFGGIVLMACLFGKNLIHLHRPDPDDRNHDLNGVFWKRHRHMDNILLNTSLCLPPHLKLPIGLGDPNIVFTNMCIHTSTICLHQAAIFMADKHNLVTVSAESKIRCITAANEIASIMRMISHMDLSTMNPFLSFCLYVSARVFVQYLKSLPDDSKTIDSLRFLLSAMNALKRRNPLTESFLVQLAVDLEALGTKVPKLKTLFPPSEDPLKCGMPNTMHNKCNPEENPAGIMQYRNECLFMKATGDDGNLATAPDIATTTPDSAQDPQMSGGAGRGPQQYQPGQTWSPRERARQQQQQQQQQRRVLQSDNGPNALHLNAMMQSDTGSLFDKSTGTTTSGGGISESNNDLDLTPDADPSNRPTPNSSTGSETRLGGNGNLAPGPMSTSGSTSFTPSPVASHQNPAGRGGGENLSGSSANLFAAFDRSRGGGGVGPNQQASFVMSPNPSDFRVQGGGRGWSAPSRGHGGPPPMSDGALRSLMNMGSLEMMDMGWDESG